VSLNLYAVTYFNICGLKSLARMLVISSYLAFRVKLEYCVFVVLNF